MSCLSQHWECSLQFTLKVETINYMLEHYLTDFFQLSQFRTGQREIIETALAKKDVLAVLPTGGGKSLCYQFPAVYLKKLVVVISPLIALMRDQVQSLQRRGIAAGCFYSGQSLDEKRQIFSQINLGGPFVLYLSPERVQKEGFQKWVQGREIALFAVDEAHCVSQWGHDFREEYAELKILKKLRPDVPILALTASATPTVLEDVAKNLKLVKPQKLVHGFYRPNLYYQVEFCVDEKEKFNWVLQALKQTPEGRIIVYCGTRKMTEDLMLHLQKMKIEKVGFYHAGLESETRSKVQEDYQSGRLRILVATNAFGMGVDQPDVRLVVHFQMPANIDSLYQEMGRAGRDEKPSTCLMLYSKKDKGLQSFFIQSSTASHLIKDLRWRNLETLISYSEAGECRHAEILTYYKDSKRIKTCGHCDVCDPKSTRRVAKPVGESIAKFSKTKTSKTESVELNELQESNYLALKKWRKEKATKLDCPAFVIFSDKTLIDLAKKNPGTIEELKYIYGIGDSKLEKYGWDILATLKT